jgi:murein DD-endopeptidase MepM/ murein hydrolase activator NlpD
MKNLGRTATTAGRPGRGSSLRAVAALAILALAAPAAAQVPRVDVRWEPDLPVQGRLFRVVVTADRPDHMVSLVARFAGEPLHFMPDDEPGQFTALAAAPIDAEGELRMPIVARWDDGARDSLEMAVPIGPGDYRLEQLMVAPRYGTQPDSALQARMRRESERAREVSRRSHETPRLWSGTIVHPRDTRVTSRFGDGRQFNGEVTSRHMGTDFAGGVGAPIRAAARGVVALVDEFHLGGNVVYLDHGDGLVTAYLHMSEQLVAEGDTVDAGDVIGRVGATGRVTGPHLHWIVRLGGITVDPLSLLEVAEADSAADVRP